MLCPLCQYVDTQVKDSRNSSDSTTIRRRRFCPKCKFRFTTVERVQLREIFVIKRSGLKKPFDREKIVNSIAAAVRKRNISQEKVNEIADDVVREIENLGAKEIPTRKIGETILKWLAQTDEVAYIRFASVYKDFTSAKDFANFISKLKNEV
jgi:transcriptional repressor NrdR